jgi:uncharacterized protein YbbC (DUF1343 family)/CubicO group peptidase (beta-lactamase class C family)
VICHGDRRPFQFFPAGHFPAILKNSRLMIRVSEAGPHLLKITGRASALFLCFTAVGGDGAPAFKASRLAEMESAITNAIAEKNLPGAVLWVERQGLTYHKSLGHRALVPGVESMTEDTIFDAASLTKVIATTPAILLLIERGLLQPDDLVRTHIPEFRGEGTATITLRHLLTHTSGLRAGLPAKPEWSGYESGIALACAETPTNAPGTVFRYSDINFILLGEIVQRVSRRKLHEFVADEVYSRLRMRDTGYLPPASQRSRIAPTEQTTNGMLRGVVHDPTARRMGGVAGHAGLFTTASDLARYARLLLNQGELDGVRLFKPETVKLMTSVQSPEGVLSRRGLGWDIDSPYSRPRGSVFPRGSFGHTGWTGTTLWMDPFSKTFFIFLSNRVHPDGKGNVVPLYLTLGTLAARAVEGFDFNQVQGALPFRTNFIAAAMSDDTIARTNRLFAAHPSLPGVLNGVDVLAKQNFAPLKNLRLGLVTNHTGQDRWRNPTIDLLFRAPGVQLKSLFSPEHGIRGALDEFVSDTVDEVTGLHVYSLYPKLPARKKDQTDPEYNAFINRLRSPPPSALTNLDALVFDIQDIGCRFYTYVATMGLCLEAAGKARIKFFVLDRVNPINGATVEGPVYHGDPHFVAWHDLPLRHGMTMGELAGLFNAERGIKADLTVIPLEGWSRSMWFDETAQPWRHPSPNMRSLNAAALYPGVGLHESALSVGRGTDTPFEIIGAPYIDDLLLAAELNKARLPGVRFVPARFTPAYSTFKDQECGGAAIVVTDRDRLPAVDVGIVIALTVQRLYPKNYALDKVETLLRDQSLIEAIRSGESLAAIKERWAADLEQFQKRRMGYLLYQ